MTTLVDAPTRVVGVQLTGEMVGSGYRVPPALVRRPDGQVLQLTRLLYLVLEAADGRRSCAEIAAVVGRALGRGVTEADVGTLVDSHLRPLGLIKPADGSDPELKRSNPLLGLSPRFAVTNPRITHLLTDPFRVLFRPVIAAAVLVGFVAVVTWVFFDRGLGASAYDAFERPHLLLLVFVVSVLSGGFHEFGHAAAARSSGAEPGVMGAGLYLVWPAFYTDVTDSYRLGRAGRIRTDLGGLYFNAIVVVLTFVWWWATGWEALLLLVATQVLQMVQQLLPLLRFDGYHVLADLAGVPDLYHRIRPTLLGLLPHRWRSPENRLLTPWARATITFWVLVTIPMMALMLLALVAAVPRLLGTAGSVVRQDAGVLADAWEAGQFLDVGGHVLQVLGVVLSVLGCALVLGRVGLRSFRGLAVWGRRSAGRRVMAAVVAATLVTALSWAWWPHPGNYRPIQAGEKGIFTTLLQEPTAPTAHRAAATTSGAGIPARPGALPAGAAARERLSGDRPLVATYEEGAALPTKEAPDLALVLVPTDRDGTGGTGGTGGTDGTDGSNGAAEQPWVFPFDKPLPPAEGDNQALAVASEDGSMIYDLAFAMVWVEDDDVLNVNEAHAYASCSDCVAVAVAFQVVLIMDDARVVVPQNLAVAANYDCFSCITAAIASQLVLSVREEPGEEQLLALGDVWGQLIAFASTIASKSLTEITEQLEAAKAEIVEILGTAPPAGSGGSSGSATSSSTPSQSGNETPAPTGPSTPPAQSAETPPAAPTPEDESSGSSQPPAGEPSATEPSPAPEPAPSTPQESGPSATSEDPATPVPEPSP